MSQFKGKKKKPWLELEMINFLKYLQNNNNVEASLFDFRPHGG